jgi:hypothetical protein
MTKPIKDKTNAEIIDDVLGVSNKVPHWQELERRAKNSGHNSISSYLNISPDPPSTITPEEYQDNFSLRNECMEMLQCGHNFNLPAFGLPPFKGDWQEMLGKRIGKTWGQLSPSEKDSQRSLRLRNEKRKENLP